jgi:hypothetical protein
LHKPSISSIDDGSRSVTQGQTPPLAVNIGAGGTGVLGGTFDFALFGVFTAIEAGHAINRHKRLPQSAPPG